MKIKTQATSSEKIFIMYICQYANGLTSRIYRYLKHTDNMQRYYNLHRKSTENIYVCMTIHIFCVDYIDYVQHIQKLERQPTF